MSRNLKLAVPIAALLLASCVPPPGSTEGPVTSQQTPAAHSNPITTTGGGSSATEPTGPAPQLAYSAPPYPWGYAGPNGNAGFPETTFAFFTGYAVSVTPSNVGPAITSCSISPDLPAGLSFSSQDCSISGTPSAASTIQVYTVTANSSTGVSKTLFSMSVSSNPPKFINLPQQAYVFPKSTFSSPKAITPITAQLGAGATAANCFVQQIPTGLTYASATCSIQGNPTSSAPMLWGPTGASYGSILTLVNNVVRTGIQPGPLMEQGAYVPITVLDTTQPWISFGGNYFAQATFTAGTAIYPITPTNQGAAITSCSVSPALPAGLTLSQTDCSISGTPTAAARVAVYVITPKSGSLSGNQLPLTLAVEPAAINALSCQSDTLCVHSLMPLWQQSDAALPPAITAISGIYTMTSDPGWCGGVSSAMLLKTYFSEIAKYSNLQTVAYPAPFSPTDDEYTFIFKSMILVQTDIQNGGTPLPSNTLNTFLGACGSAIDFSSTLGQPSELAEYWNPSQYSHGMPLGWISITNPTPPGHAVTLNGVEGNYYKIFDPWGAVYNATISYTTPGVTAKISFVSGNDLNDVEKIGNGSTGMFDIQWIKDYVHVKGARSPETCQ